MVNFLDAELRGTDTDRARIARDGVLGPAVPGVDVTTDFRPPADRSPGTVTRLATRPGVSTRTTNAPVRGRSPQFSGRVLDRYGVGTVTIRVVVPILPHPSVEVRVTV